jgi:hypothetical protein
MHYISPTSTRAEVAERKSQCISSESNHTDVQRQGPPVTTPVATHRPAAASA